MDPGQGLRANGASGDPGTFVVRVSRDASGREIRWEFLSWK